MGASQSEPSPRLGYDNRYEKVSCLGRGGFGTVWLVRKNAQYYAMKRLDLPRSRNVADVVLSALNNNEIRILRNLNHRNVVKYQDSFYQIAGPLKGIYIVMEYCQGGSLRDPMRNAGPTGTPPNPLYIINLMMQICEGLAYIHSNGLIHRDIKPDNIFIDISGNIKIGDFGCCKVFDLRRDNQMANTNLGTPRYKAPEVGQYPYSYASDMYSTGVVFFDLWSFVPPDLQRPRAASEMNSLITKLKSRDPRHRPTAAATSQALCSIRVVILIR